MFKIVAKSSYSWPVKLKLPADGGRFEEHTFDVTFKRLDKTGVDDVQKAFSADGADLAAIARPLVLGWNGIENDAGPIPFSDTALDDLLAIHRVAPAIIGAFFESSFSVERKN